MYTQICLLNISRTMWSTLPNEVSTNLNPYPGTWPQERCLIIIFLALFFFVAALEHEGPERPHHLTPVNHRLQRGSTRTMVWLKRVSVTFARRVLWLCPGHIYSRALDTYTTVSWTHTNVPWTRSISVSLTHFNVSLPHLYMEKTKNIDTFQALTRFSNHGVEETCEDFGNYICSGNWTQNLGAYTGSLYHMAKKTLLINTHVFFDT